MGGRKGSRILSNSRAVVLHQGGQCRRAGRMKGQLICAQQPRMKRISCKGQAVTSVWCDGEGYRCAPGADLSDYPRHGRCQEM